MCKTPRTKGPIQVSFYTMFFPERGNCLPKPPFHGPYPGVGVEQSTYHEREEKGHTEVPCRPALPLHLTPTQRVPCGLVCLEPSLTSAQTRHGPTPGHRRPEDVTTFSVSLPKEVMTTGSIHTPETLPCGTSLLPLQDPKRRLLCRRFHQR